MDVEVKVRIDGEEVASQLSDAEAAEFIRDILNSACSDDLDLDVFNHVMHHLIEAVSDPFSSESFKLAADEEVSRKVRDFRTALHGEKK